MVSSLIYAFPGAVVIEAWKNGGTALYSDLSAYGYWYVPVSVFLYLFLHDTFFYWTHRLMHHPRLFATMHKTHHMSNNPTPWAAFSFHPWESILTAFFLPLLVFVIPLHAGGGAVHPDPDDNRQCAQSYRMGDLSDLVDTRLFRPSCHYSDPPQSAPHQLQGELWALFPLLGQAHGHRRYGERVTRI